jgi:type I restriction enzyme R subunit
MCRPVRRAFEQHLDVDRDCLCKASTLVQQHSESELIQHPERVYELSAEALEAIANQSKPDTLKVLTLIEAFAALEHKKGAEQPHLIAIAERRWDCQGF